MTSLHGFGPPPLPSLSCLPCALIRGGTSKGVFVLEEHLPADGGLRDKMLLDLMGSPDPRQINGLGGADPLTSKVAIISRSSRDGIDVEYESVEVGVAEPSVTHGLMCGNLLAGVGYFAMAEGLVATRAPLTTVRIYCRSNQKVIIAKVPAFSPGAGGSDSVELSFPNPQGAITGKLLPANGAISRLTLDNGKTFEASIVDAGTLYAFIRAEAFGLNGMETPGELDGKAEFRATIEALRGQVAQLINRHRPKDAVAITPRRVKVAIFAPPTGVPDAHIAAIVINTAKVHKAFAVSGGMALAAAAAIRGSLVNAVYAPEGSPFELHIRHPSGMMSLGMHWSSGVHGTVIHAAEIRLSARMLLQGTAYLPPQPSAMGAVQGQSATANLDACPS